MVTDSLGPTSLVRRHLEQSALKPESSNISSLLVLIVRAASYFNSFSLFWDRIRCNWCLRRASNAIYSPPRWLWKCLTLQDPIQTQNRSCKQNLRSNVPQRPRPKAHNRHDIHSSFLSNSDDDTRDNIGNSRAKSDMFCICTIYPKTQITTRRWSQAR